MARRGGRHRPRPRFYGSGQRAPLHGDGYRALRPRVGPGPDLDAGPESAEQWPAEAFLKTFERDYVDGAELRDAESIFAQLSGWIEDYNTRAPHSALGIRNPARVSGALTLSSSR
jgi:hypothetical protein